MLGEDVFNPHSKLASIVLIAGIECPQEMILHILATSDRRLVEIYITGLMEVEVMTARGTLVQRTMFFRPSTLTSVNQTVTWQFKSHGFKREACKAEKGESE
jgi:uncharacterized UPF0146 family protein